VADLKISGSGRIDSLSARREKRDAGGKTFTTSETADTQQASALTHTGPLAAMDSILALQGLDDYSGGHRQSMAQGEQLLNLLDQVRDGLLSGGIPRLTLTRLALAVAQRRASFADPKLSSILDEIEPRAKVELAKLEQADQPNT
jgi:hypothetical protein